LRSLLQIATQFVQRQQRRQEESDLSEDDEDDSEDDYNEWEDFMQEDESLLIDNDDDTTEWTEEELQQLAVDIVAEGLTNQWGGALRGVQALDQLFGFNHGLLNVQDATDNNDNDNNDNSIGFGWNDGVWSHSGWQLLPQLQREMACMPELRDLIQALGRRPTAERSDAMHKFVPRKWNEEGALGAQYDPSLRESVRGITLSGSLSEMLPSEAILLVQKRQQKTSDDPEQQQQQEKDEQCQNSLKSPPSSALRRLFLAKMVESKLLSYESSGWQDVPSMPVTKPRFLSRLPSAPGGPILICLDTSWSMTGRREQLSKAVVLACVSAAHKQQREIQVVAFSSARNVMETGPIAANAAGVARLLEFLSSSFGGGTDVTGALKHAMTTVALSSSSLEDGENRPEDKGRTYTTDDSVNTMAAADILLVTDGEIPDPPVSQDLMEALDRLKKRAGVQVHGLLVGKRESVPLAKLCTHIHDFLIGYDTVLPQQLQQAMGPAFSAQRAVSSPTRLSLKSTASPLSDVDRVYPQKSLMFLCNGSLAPFGFSAGLHKQRRKFSLLEAKFSDFDGDDDWGGRDRRGGKTRNNRYNGDDEEDFTLEEDNDFSDVSSSSTNKAKPKIRTTQNNDDPSSSAEEAVASLRALVTESIQEQKWKISALDEEKNSEESCWQYRAELKSAIDRMAEGLVERDEEARLVVLAMVSREHILLLGTPGTAKSVLGRRLSQLCGGTFFQRLLTRFTTPEEIFGPLSLRALENDVYRRITAGFLPTSEVAFLDEIFKANSAILNTLLTILNERQFDNGAGMREECPIRCVVGASNELPESDELDALYDRFLLRKEVLPVSDDGVMKMLGMPVPGSSPCDDGTIRQNSAACDSVFSDHLDDLIIAISAAADKVVMDTESCALLRDLRTFMREDLDVEISDRRLVKATRLLKVSAASHGRTKVDPLDCLLLQHAIWRLPEERSRVKAWLWSRITPGSSDLTTATDESLESAAFSSVKKFRILLDGVRQTAAAVVRKTSGDINGEAGARKEDVDAIQSLSEEANRIAFLLQQRSDALERHAELLRRSRDHLWLDPDEAQAAHQLLLPRAMAYIREVDQALSDARALMLALSSRGDISNDDRLLALDLLWDDNGSQELTFSEDAMALSMKEAKTKYDTETFRKWKRARKKVQN